MTTITNKNTHFLAADILRGVAILMVIVFHAFIIPFGGIFPWNGWSRSFDAVPSRTFLLFYPISFGWAGVALFFVLSGFCIHLSFLRSTGFSARRFFWNRFWRIMPAYFVAVAGLGVLERLAFTTREGLKQFISHLLFVHDLDGSTFFGINPSFWSIATEMQLYLLFPLLLLIRRRKGIQACLAVTLVVGLVWRAFAVVRWGLPDSLITPALTSPLMTWFDWTLGAFVAERLDQSQAAFKHRPLWLAITVPAFVVSTLYKPLTIFSFSLAAVVSAVVLDWLVRREIRQTAAASILGFIGTVSYSIYLWHQPMLYQLVPRISRYANIYVTCVTLIVLILLLAYLSFHLIERRGIIAGKVLWNHMQKSLITRSGEPSLDSSR